jgi:hypothetical protein
LLGLIIRLGLFLFYFLGGEGRFAGKSKPLALWDIVMSSSCRKLKVGAMNYDPDRYIGLMKRTVTGNEHCRDIVGSRVTAYGYLFPPK